MSGITRVGMAAEAVATEGSDATGVASMEAEMSPLLPDPEGQLLASGDPGAMVASLAVEMAKDERDLSQEIEQTEAALQDQQEKAQVQAMHEKASAMRVQAWTSGLVGAAQGLMSIGAAGASDSAAKDGVGKLGRGLEGGAKVIGAGRDISSGIASGGNEEADADIAAHEHAASHASRAVTQTYDNERDAQKLLDTALDFYKEYESVKDQARAAAVHRG